jgi:replication-associated recombination protein RarA
VNPANYIPLKSADFIGQSAKLGALLERKAVSGASSVKVLIVGSPGCGKTALCNLYAKLAAKHSTCVESVNGRNVDVGLVRRWQESACYRPMTGGMSVKIVNELDTATSAAQDVLLTYLDEMPAHIAFLATSNLNLSALAERFQTRLQQFRLAVPSSKEIAGLLGKFGIEESLGFKIGERAKGNVRAALLDAQSILDARELERIAA